MDYNSNDCQQQTAYSIQQGKPTQQEEPMQPVYQQPYQQSPKASNPMAIGALVCGIVSIVFCWFGWFSFVALALSVVGIVLGIKGMSVAKTTNSEKGLAIAGLVCGIVGAALSLIAVISYIWLISTVNSFASLLS